MALTNAERQRKYREKRDNDAARRAEYLRKKQEKYLQDLASGKRQLVSDLTYRSQRYQRKQWREQQFFHLHIHLSLGLHTSKYQVAKGGNDQEQNVTETTKNSKRSLKLKKRRHQSI